MNRTFTRYYGLLFFLLAAIPPLTAIPSIESLFNQGSECYNNGDFEQAIEYYTQALTLSPANPTILFNLGRSYEHTNQLDQAVTHYQQTLSIHPSSTQVLNALGCVLLKQQKLSAAHLVFKQSFDLDPQQIHAPMQLANLYTLSNNNDEAIDLYEKILCHHPTCLQAHYNLAYSLKQIGDFEHSITSYEKTLELNPNADEAHLGLAKSLLATGNFTKGWHHFEWRFSNSPQVWQSLNYQNIDPQKLAGKRVLIRAEWGLGDMIQFVRYAQKLKECGAIVTLQAFDPLVPLLSLCPYIDQVVSDKTPVYPNFDYQIPFLSLPLLFKTTVETIPNTIPYLVADRKLVDAWKTTLADDTNFKIGICWQGKSDLFIEKHPLTKRSVALELFAPLAQIQGVTLYSLQKGEGEEQLQTVCFAVKDFGPDFDKKHGRYMDTAAVMKNLDLFISVDTSTVHLAGGLGVPTWVLIPFVPEWRWMTKRTDSPWYPEIMRLFRQPEPGNWNSVFNQIEQEVKKLVPHKKGNHVVT